MKASTSPPCRNCRWSSSATTTSTPTPRRSARRWPAPTWPTADRPTACRPRSWTATTCWRSTKPPGAPWPTRAAGLGPYLLECKTFRMTGHSAHDGGPLRPQEPVRRVGETRSHRRAWKRRCWPGAGPSQDEIDELHADIRREVDEAVAWAEASPYPEPATLLDDVYENP